MQRLVRGVQRLYVFTHHRTLDQYLRALGRRFGTDVDA